MELNVAGQPAYAYTGGKPFDPETATQTEVGVKWQPLDDRLLLALAGYDLTKKNEVTADPLGNKTQTGEIRSLGLEMEGTLDLQNGFRMVASYTHNNAEIRSHCASDNSYRFEAIHTLPWKNTETYESHSSSLGNPRMSIRPRASCQKVDATFWKNMMRKQRLRAR